MMRKIIAAGAALVLLTGCGVTDTEPVSSLEEPSSEPETSAPKEVAIDEPSFVMEGVVYDVDGDTLLIDCEEGGKFTASFNRLPEDIAPGDTVDVEHTGEILECYPAIIGEVLDVNVVQKAQRPMQYVSGSGDTFAYSLLAPADWQIADPEIGEGNGGVRLNAPDGSGAVEVVCGKLGVCGTGLTIIEDKIGGMDVSYYSYSEGTWDFAAFPDYDGLYIANTAAPENYDDICAMLDTLEII